jgi:ATP-dependent DNA helicase RecQ
MQEIARSLGLCDPVVVSGSFARPNLRFNVRHVSKDADRLAALVEILDRLGFRDSEPGRAIIYCATRKAVETVAQALKASGVRAGYYHAGRTDNARERAQRSYESRRTPVLVATNAFGMGVDNPDVRLIVHFQTPGSVEAYYQEAGRAGRDGEPAECHLFFGVRDLVTQRMLGRGGSSGAAARRRHLLSGIEAYARSGHCRQEFFTTYFTGQDTPALCGVCDVCVDPEAVETLRTESATSKRNEPAEALPRDALETIVAAAAALRRPVGKSVLAKALRGSRAKEVRRRGLLDLQQHGALAAFGEKSITGAIEDLIRDKRLERRGQKYPTVWLAGRAVRPPRGPDAPPKQRPPRGRKSDLSRDLENYRRRAARRLKWKKAYMVFTNEVIAQIDTLRPDSLWALEEIRGLGPKKIERFGEDILEMVRRHA